MKPKPIYTCVCCRRSLAVRTDAQGRCGQCRAGTPDPTPEEITERCAEIQAGWSDYEEQERRAVKNSPHDYGTPTRVARG